MILITRNEIKDLLGESIGISTYDYAEKRLRNRYTKKKQGTFMRVNALNLSNIILLLKKANEEPKRGSRWPSKWRDNYDMVIERLEAHERSQS